MQPTARLEDVRLRGRDGWHERSDWVCCRQQERNGQVEEAAWGFAQADGGLSIKSVGQIGRRGEGGLMEGCKPPQSAQARHHQSM